MKKICSTAQKKTKKLCTLNGDGAILSPPPVSLDLYPLYGEAV